jgi:hypothetical protein
MEGALLRATLKRAWTGWREFGVYLGDFQSRLLLTVFYFTVLMPYGAITAVFGDPLSLRGHASQARRTAWVSRQPEDATLKRAGQTF